MNRLLRLAPLLCVPLLGALVYWPGLSGGFLFDDFANLVRDPDWKATSLAPTELYRAMSLGISSDIGRPLAMLSFALNHAFTGMAPFPLKLTGLAFHLFNGMLVLLLCRQLLQLAPAGPERERMGIYAAMLVTLAWVVHPLQVSSALYIVQRMEVGAHTGALLALLCYLRARRCQQVGQWAWPWFVLAGGCTLLGLGFKETALLVPGYALALEICVLRFRTKDLGASQKLMLAYGVGIALALAAFVFMMLPRYLPEAAYASRDFTLGQRLLTQPHVLATYLSQIVLPLPSTLLFYYDHFPISRGLLDPPGTLRSLLLLAMLAVAAVAARRRWPLVTLGIAWFFIAHALTSNVVPLELAFEHRNYFALLGILLALAQVLAWAGARLHMDARRTLAVLLVLFLATLCLIQARTWGDPFGLAMALASRNPESPRASYDLGQRMLIMAGSDRSSPLLDLATREFEHAARLPASSALPEQALIVILARQDKPVPPELWAAFRTKISQRAAGPHEVAALHGLLDCRIRQQCRFDDQALLDAFFLALERNPRSPRIHSLYGSLAYNVLSDRTLGMNMMREAIRLAPRETQYKVNLARMLTATGADPDELASLTRQIRSEDRHQRHADELRAGFRPVSRSDE